MVTTPTTTPTAMSTTPTFTMNTISCKVIQRIEKINKLGKAPLNLQLFINKQRLVIPLGMMIPPQEWDKSAMRIIILSSSNKKELQQYNELLIRYLDRVNDLRHHYEMIDTYITKEQFRKDFAEDSRKYGVVQFIEKEIVDLVLVRSPGSIKNLRTTINKLKVFSPEVRFGEIDHLYLTRWEGYLRRTKLSNGTVWKHMKDLRMILNLAVKRGMKINEAFKNYRIKRVAGKRFFLDKSEVILLEQLYSSGTLTGELSRVLKYFLFSCYTGLRLSDVKQIAFEDIMDGQLTYNAVKTAKDGKISRVPLNKNAWKYITVTEGKLFETYVDQVTNRYLKEIAVRAGIKKRLTFHMSRHSFAMLFLEASGTVLELKEVLHHSKIETTMVYTHIKNADVKAKMMLMDN